MDKDRKSRPEANMKARKSRIGANLRVGKRANAGEAKPCKRCGLVLDPRQLICPRCRAWNV